MKIERIGFSGWNDYPVYYCRQHRDYEEISKWMSMNKVEKFLISSGSNGYKFQVKTNHEWFVLRWM